MTRNAAMPGTTKGTSAFETERLLLRPPRLADAPALFEFLGDQPAMRHTHAHADLRETRRCLAAYACQSRKTGCGLWVVETRHDGRIIGLGGLYDDPFDQGWSVEVAYFFARPHWGRGYASELIAFTLAWAMAQGLWPVINAFAHPDNGASRHVLTKAGFREQRFVPEMDRILYRYP